MQYFLLALRKFAVFTGRARRKEYWMFVLFQIIFTMAAGMIDVVLGTGLGPGGTGIGYVYMLFALAMIIPGLALAVRRLHDVNKSGWFLLIGLLPVVGGIWLLVLMCTEGTQGDNQYGPDPKAVALAY